MFNKSINITLTLVFALLLTIPLLFALPSLLSNAPSKIYQENLKKYALFSSGIADNIHSYIESQLSDIVFLDFKLQQDQLTDDGIQKLVDDYLNTNQQITAISLLTLNGDSVKTFVNKDYRKANEEPLDLDYIASEKKYRTYSKKNDISAVFSSKISKKPVILVTHHLINNEEDKIGTLMIEVNTTYISDLCNKVQFGNNSHCAVIDNKNTFISHYKKAFANGLKKSKELHILKKLKQFTYGSTQYESTKGNVKMLAGFKKIESLGWSVYVYQPESEILDYFSEFKFKLLIFSVAGLVLPLLLAVFAIHFITTPLRALFTKTKNLAQNSEYYLTGKVPKRASKDIKSLWNEIDELVLANQNNKEEIYSLSRASSLDVRKAVAELRKRNINDPSNLDPETGVTNQQTFTTELQKCLHIHKEKYIGLITFKADNFDSVIDERGQKAATNYMSQIALLLNENIRTGDMVMSPGDTNFITVYIDSNEQKALVGAAKKLMNIIEGSIVNWKNELISSEVSTELLFKKVDSNTTAEQLIIASRG